MDLSVPWVPTTNGNVLRPLARYDEVVDSACAPVPRQDRPWVKTTYSDIFSKHPQAGEALWESVLALWRLKVVVPEEADVDDDLWAEHVLAWLVSTPLSRSSREVSLIFRWWKGRHRDLCWYLDIEPFKVIQNFAEGEGAVGNLDKELIPSWTKPVPVPEPSLSTPRPRPRRTPAASSDVAMEIDVPEPSQPVGKGKGRSDDVGGGLTRSKSKRALQDSPSKVHPDPKRARQDDEVSEVDLADLTIDEDSLVDPELVPGIVGKVSSWAVTSRCSLNGVCRSAIYVLGGRGMSSVRPSGIRARVIPP